MASQEPHHMLVDPAILGSIISADVIETILNAVVAHEYDKHLRSLELSYAVGRIIEDASSAVNSRLPQLDALLDQHRPFEARPVRFNLVDLTALQDEGSWDLGAEPRRNQLDSWAQSSIPTRRPAADRSASVSGSTISARDKIKSMRNSRADLAAVTVLATSGGPTSPHEAPGIAATHVLTTVAEANATGPSKLHSLHTQQPVGRGVKPAPSVPKLLPSPSAAPTRSSSASSVANVASAAKGKPIDEAKRRGIAAKAMAGKQVTYDERGNPVLVQLPNPSKIAAMQVPVSVLVEGAPASLGSSVVAAMKSQALAQLAAAPAEKVGIPKQTAAATDAIKLKFGVKDAVPDSKEHPPKSHVDKTRFFRPQPGVQPSLVDTLSTNNQVAPGVVVAEPGGKTVAGRPLSPGLTKEEFDKSSKAVNAKVRAEATTSLRRPARAAQSPPPPAAVDVPPSGPSVPSVVIDPLLKPSRFPAGARPSEILSSIPDVIPRTQSSTLRAAASQSLRDSFVSAENKTSYTVQSPKPGSGLDFRSRAEARRADNRSVSLQSSVTSVRDNGPFMSSKASSLSQPREEPRLEGGKHRHQAVGDVSKRPRDRAGVAAATVPKEHLPAPLYPAVAHYDALDYFSESKYTGPSDDDLVVVDGSVEDETSGYINDNGVMLPARMGNLTRTPSPRPSRSPSPIGKEDSYVNKNLAASTKEWGLTASRKLGGSVRIGGDR